MEQHELYYDVQIQHDSRRLAPDISVAEHSPWVMYAITLLTMRRIRDKPFGSIVESRL